MKRKFLIFAVIMFAFFLTVNAQRNEGDEGYAGSETCMDCHEEHYQTYMKNYHAVKRDPRTPGARRGCESCHGPGAVHVDEGGEGGILSLSATAPTAVETKNAVCLECHEKGTVSLWHGSTHENRAVSCSDCHSIHDRHRKSLAKSTQTEVCTQCHRRIESESLRQSHHPIREGKIKCSDCHNSHGTIADKLVDAQHINLKCFECHAEKRGPFLWEHPPVVEDCLSCHTPHGSFRSTLLNAKMPYLCQRCHANSVHSGINELQARSPGEAGQPVYRALNNRAFYRACLNCHTAIHGSNHPSGKSLVR